MNKRAYPQIRIKNGWLIYQNASVHLHKLWGKNKKLASMKEVDLKILSYQKAWDKHEKQIMEGMQKILGLKFNQNIIDVYIAPWFDAFSDPMVIGNKFDPEYFVDVLTHELLHRLLTDNTKIKKIRLIPKWKKCFGKNHNLTTLVHIPVHATQKAIFIEILKQPSRAKRDFEKMKELKAKDYISSWQYVEKNDYRDLIKRVKSVYR